MAVVDKLLNKANKNKESGTLGEFISMLFGTRDAAHAAHLKTTSFAEHKALDDYYSGIVDLVDSLAESAQGKYGLLTIPMPTCDCYGGDCVTMFNEFVTKVQTIRGSLPQDSYIQNQIDEVEALMYSTIYKLKHLK